MRDEYAGVNSEGLAVSGIWSEDTYLEDEGISLVKLTGNSQIGWTWDGSEWLEPPKPIVSFNMLREERDKLLAESDYTQIADVPFSDEKKLEWLMYRQELRDLPDEYEPTSTPSYPNKPKE